MNVAQSLKKLLDNRRFNELEQLSDRILSINEGEHLARYCKFIARRANGDIDNTLDLILRCISDCPERDIYKLSHGYLLCDLGRYDEAIAVFQPLLANPSQARAASDGVHACLWLRDRAQKRPESIERIDKIMHSSTEKIFTTVISGDFKWGHDSPSYGSMFMGSSDYGAVRNLDLILSHINLLGIPEGDIDLVSIIGGMYFLKLISVMKFDKITLFDQNIAEHSKIAFLYRYLLQTPYDDFDGFKDVDEYIFERSDLFYKFPAGGKSHQIEFTGKANFRWMDQIRPMQTMLSPIYYQSRTWHPSKDEYYAAIQEMKDSADTSLHFNFPETDAQGKIVLVFLCDAQIPETILHEKIKNSPLILPIRSYNDNHEALDPHKYWVYMARRSCLGDTLHIWAPEDEMLCGTHYDAPFKKGIKATDLVKGEPIHGYSTALLHIFTGKLESAAGIEDRVALYRATLRQLRSSVKRVVVAEYNKECPAFRDYPWVLGREEIIRLLQEELPGYRFSNEHLAPGGDHPNRNIFLSFDME